MPNTPTSAAMAPTVVANRDTLNHSTTSLETEPDRLQAEVGQAEEGSQIRTTEGSVEHIEALGMDGVGTSTIEGLDPCLQPHHPPFTGMSRFSLRCDQAASVSSGNIVLTMETISSGLVALLILCMRSPFWMDFTMFWSMLR